MDTEPHPQLQKNLHSSLFPVIYFAINYHSQLLEFIM